MMRSFTDEKQCPLLWASTYSAGEHLDPSAFSDFFSRKKTKKIAKRVEPQIVEKIFEASGHPHLTGKAPINLISLSDTDGSCGVTSSSKMMVIQGYKAQSEMVIEYLDRLITNWELKNECAIVEGVHLSLNFVV